MLVDALLDANRRSARTLAVSDGATSLNYKQLTRLAMILRDVVVENTQRKHVGLMLPATAVFPAALFGTWWCEKVAVPLNFLLHGDELARIVEDADIDLILTIRPFAELSQKLPARTVFLEDLPIKRRMLTGVLRRPARAPDVDPDDTAVILFTSGTSAKPKGVMLTYRNLHSNCVDTIESLRLLSHHSFLNVLPPFHVFGLTANTLVPVFLRTSVHAIPRFDPLSVVRTVERERIAIMMAVPSMYAAILRTKSSNPDAFRSIYLAIAGGEPLPDSVRDGFAERFGIPLRQGYGLTETSPIVAVSSVDASREGTVGRPISNVSVRIVDAEGGDLSVGEEGEILVSGPGVMKGYYQQPQATAEVIDAKGWLHTGDVGRIDDDGFLAITGRAKEMLIIGGENVFPREIEVVLEAHEHVLQAAVIGIADPLRGEAPVAFVIPNKGAELTGAELRIFARKSLPSFKTPKRIEIRDDLPTGPTGKIVKRKLRELL